MKRLMLPIALILTGLLVVACSDSSSDAPEPGKVHSKGWIITHEEEALSDPDGCAGCHGVNFTGGGSGNAVSCFSCHTAGLPFEFAECTSCHNTPPDSYYPAGSTRPNRQGGHFSHKNLPVFEGQEDCTACHYGAGADTPEHYDTQEPANVAILERYNARESAASYDAEFMTCTNVSCHGGQETPSWPRRIFVEESCELCHEFGPSSQTPQFNSYFSGYHDIHINRLDFSCDDCHDTDQLGRKDAPNHFSGLETPVFEQDPATTMKDYIGYDMEAQTCTTNNGTCHGGEVRLWSNE